MSEFIASRYRRITLRLVFLSYVVSGFDTQSQFLKTQQNQTKSETFSPLLPLND